MVVCPEDAQHPDNQCTGRDWSPVVCAISFTIRYNNMKVVPETRSQRYIKKALGIDSPHPFRPDNAVLPVVFISTPRNAVSSRLYQSRMHDISFASREWRVNAGTFGVTVMAWETLLYDGEVVP